MCSSSLGMTDDGSCEHMVHSIFPHASDKCVQPDTIHVAKLFISAGLWMIWESSMMLEMDYLLWFTRYDR